MAFIVDEGSESYIVRQVRITMVVGIVTTCLMRAVMNHDWADLDKWGIFLKLKGKWRNSAVKLNGISMLANLQKSLED